MTRRRSTARRAPQRGGQQGYEPPVTRMRRDERILELALERWSQRQIAAEVGLTQGGVSKALRRILTRQLTTMTEGGVRPPGSSWCCWQSAGRGQPGRGTRAVRRT